MLMAIFLIIYQMEKLKFLNSAALTFISDNFIFANYSADLHMRQLYVIQNMLEKENFLKLYVLYLLNFWNAWIFIFL